MAIASFPRAGVTAIKLSDRVPTPLRGKVRMRGNLKAFPFLIPLTPALSRKEREFSYSYQRVKLRLINEDCC